MSEEVRYFVSSPGTDDSAELARSIRAHRAIENNLHRVLDAAFDEDGCQNKTNEGGLK